MDTAEGEREEWGRLACDALHCSAVPYGRGRSDPSHPQTRRCRRSPPLACHGAERAGPLTSPPPVPPLPARVRRPPILACPVLCAWNACLEPTCWWRRWRRPRPPRQSRAPNATGPSSPASQPRPTMPVRRSPDRPQAPQLLPPIPKSQDPRGPPAAGDGPTPSAHGCLPRRYDAAEVSIRHSGAMALSLAFSGKAETPTETCVAPPSAAQQHAARRQMGRGTEDGERRETRDGPTGEQWGGPFSSADLENGKCDERAASRLTSPLSGRCLTASQER
jgi:hypothetical protein